MKFDTNEERAESTERILKNCDKDIAKLLNEFFTWAEDCNKSLEIILLDVYYNVNREEFEILGVFKIYGTMFWVERAATLLFTKSQMCEFKDEVAEWYNLYVTKKKKIKHRKWEAMDNVIDAPVNRDNFGGGGEVAPAPVPLRNGGNWQVPGVQRFEGNIEPLPGGFRNEAVNNRAPRVPQPMQEAQGAQEAQGVAGAGRIPHYRNVGNEPQPEVAHLPA